MFSPLSLFILNSFQWCHKLTCQATQTNRAMLWKRQSVSLSKEVFVHWTNHITNPFCCQRCWRFSATRVTSCSIHASGTEVEETAHLSCTVLLFQTLLCRLSYSLFDFYYFPYFFQHVCLCARMCQGCTFVVDLTALIQSPAICHMWSSVGWWMRSDCGGPLLTHFLQSVLCVNGLNSLGLFSSPKLV